MIKKEKKKNTVHIKFKKIAADKMNQKINLLLFYLNKFKII
jgi:hypothetical protein